jgi:hypothetical protein
VSLFRPIVYSLVRNAFSDSFIDTIASQGHNKGELTPYLMFQYAIKTEITRKYYAKERIATMGRLSELQIVEWEIDRQGKSQYTLKQEKLSLLD